MLELLEDFLANFSDLRSPTRLSSAGQNDQWLRKRDIHRFHERKHLHIGYLQRRQRLPETAGYEHGFERLHFPQSEGVLFAPGNA